MRSCEGEADADTRVLPADWEGHGSQASGDSGEGPRLWLTVLWCPAGTVPQVCFAEDISAVEEDQTVSQGRQKKKGNKPLEKTSAEKEKGKHEAWKWRGADSPAD